MPVLRYFLNIGIVLLALLFIADASLPKLPVGKATDTPTPVIRIYSAQKMPERINFDTSTATPREAAPTSPLALNQNLVDVNSAQQTAAVTPGRAREALAQMQTPELTQIQANRPKKPDAQRQRKIAKRYFARPPPRIARSYAWFGDRTWW